MGKLAAVATFGSTGTVASLGGAYFLGVFGSSNLDIPSDLTEFKTKNGGDIVASYFPGVSLSQEGGAWSSSSPGSSFLGNDTTQAEGRLVVNWEKFKCSPDESNKWTGRIRWLWAFKNGDKGLVLYASAKANSTTDSKLDAEGVIYSLEKRVDGWKVKQNHKKASPSTTGGEVDDADNKFPGIGDALKTGLNVKEHWGFLDSTKLTNLCKWEESKVNNQKPEKEFKGSWTWKPKEGTDGKKPFDWSKTSHQWLTTFYGTPDPTLENLVTSFYGIWSEEYFVNKDLGVTVSQTQ